MLQENSQKPMQEMSALLTAQKIMPGNRTQKLAALNALFRSGRVPDPTIQGRFTGKLIALDVAPGLTESIQLLVNAWMPWVGKTFNDASRRGDNIFLQESRLLARLLNPFYRGFMIDTPATYRGFSFRTYQAPGLADPDRQVLKIDYDLAENPRLTVRRVLDELVQLDEQNYLGKAHVHWWWGRWQTVAYFTLSR